MGRLSVAALRADERFELVAEADVDDDLASTIASRSPDVVLDFTSSECVYENATKIVTAGVRPVIGTSGLLDEHVEELRQRCRETGVGGLVVPNFSIAAVLLMRFSAEAVKHLPRVEIIEAHHDRKMDSPSGTALRTAELLAASRQVPPPKLEETETVPGARGACYKGIPIHAVRLPGIESRQEVLFGGHSQLLSLRCDSMSRESYVPGILKACFEVMHLSELKVGLDHVL
jgi:4-hydroxy-tetrahydrodipicolinate reductase